MKRKSCSTSYAGAKKAKYGKAVRLYRNPVSYGKLERSAVYHESITNGSLYPFGLHFNANGFYVGSVGIAWIGNSDIYSAYDAYRLDKVMVQFSYNNNSANVSGIAETLPDIYTAVDYDSASVLTIADVLSRDGSRLDNFGENGGKKVIRTFAPKVAPLAYATTTSSGYLEPKAGQWVASPAGFTDVQHYGLLALVDSSQQIATTGTNGVLTMFVRAWFSLKHSN